MRIGWDRGGHAPRSNCRREIGEIGEPGNLGTDGTFPMFMIKPPLKISHFRCSLARIDEF